MFNRSLWNHYLLIVEMSNVLMLNGVTFFSFMLIDLVVNDLILNGLTWFSLLLMYYGVVV